MINSPAIRGDFLTDLEARSLYSEGAGIYRIVPEAVARPADEEAVRTLLRWATEHRVPLTPRGAGSSVTGSNVGAGVILDLTRMGPKVLQVDAGNSTARTSASVRWGELTELSLQSSLRLPPDPSSGAFATLGGMVSTNASGARSVRYGSVRRWVRGLTFLTADGERATLRRGEPAPRRITAVRRFEEDVAPAIRQARALIDRSFPRTSKNSAGYALNAWQESGDLVDLLIGAEGTLGIVTEIEWQLDPVPPIHAGLQVSLGSLDDLDAAVSALLPLQPSALELLDRTFLDLVRANQGPGIAPAVAETLLIVQFEGEHPGAIRERVGDAVRRLQGIALDVETAITPDEEARLWALRHAASPIIADLPPGRRSLQVIEDACVPLPAMGVYISFVRQLATRLGVPIVIFGHAGDGNIHVNLLPETDRPGWEAAVGTLHQETTAKVIGLGGTPSGEHGDGRIRSSTLEQLYGPDVVHLFRRVKAAFDPHGILNAGVKLPGPIDEALRNLKVGGAAAPIPAAIAEELREIERRGDYRRDRLSRM